MSVILSERKKKYLYKIAFRANVSDYKFWTISSQIGQGFQRDGTVQLFGTKGQKFLHCPGTKGQWDNLAMGRDGPGQPVKIQDGRQEGTITIFLSKSGTGQDPRGDITITILS